MKKSLAILAFVWSFVLFLPAQESPEKVASEKKAEKPTENKSMLGEFGQLFLSGEYEKSLNKAPNDRYKALCLWRLGRVEALQKLVASSKDNKLAGDKIRLAVLSKGPKAATVQGLSALKADSENDDLFVEVMQAAIESGDLYTLKSLVNRQVKVANLDALSLERMIDAKIKVGTVLMKPELTRDAVITLCDEAVKKFPWNPRFNMIRCLYYYRVGQRIDAGDFVQEMKEAKALDPYMLKLPKKEKAAEALIPEDVTIFENNLMVIEHGINTHLLGYETFAGTIGRQNAKPLIDRYAKLAPKHPNTYVYRGVLKFIKSQKDDLPKEIAEVTVLHGGYHFMLSQLVAGSFDRLPAIPYGRKALAKEPWNVDWMISHAINCHREGFEAEALKYLKRAHQHEPRIPTVYNLKKLLESMEVNYEKVVVKNFRVFMRRDEHHAFKMVLLPVLRSEYDTLSKRYGVKPKEITVKLFSDKQDFDVSVFAVPSAPAIGACMGRLVTMPAPSYLEYHLEPWAAVLRHELAHSFHIEKSDGRVSRWFTEGLAHYEEYLASPVWDWEDGYDQKLIDLKAQKKLAKFGKLNPAFNGPDVRFYYQYCRWIIEWLHQEKGWNKIMKFLEAYAEGVGEDKLFDEVLGLSNEEAEKEFQTWLNENVISKIPYPELIRGPLTTESGLAVAYDTGDYFKILKATKNATSGVQLFYRAMAVEELEGGDAAAKIYDKAKAQMASHFMFNYRYGRNLYEEGSFKEAEQALLKAIEIYPNRVKKADNPYYWLYQVYNENKRAAEKDKNTFKSQEAEKKAIEVIWQFTRVQQKDHRARFWLVRRYREAKNYKRVNLLLKEIREIYPYHFEAILWDAESAQRSGDKKFEKECYERLFACGVLEDLVDQDTLWTDKERLDFLKKGIKPWLAITSGKEKLKAAQTIAKYFPHDPLVIQVLKELKN